MRKLEGISIAEFLASDSLRSADVLLEHSRASFWGWLVRLGTGNYWNHALMVCSAKDTSGKDEILVIDPRLGGLHIVNIAAYFEMVKDYDVAVKRLDTDWFQNDNENAGIRLRRTVADFSLRRIDSQAAVAVSLGSVRRFLRKLRLMARFIRQKRTYPKRRKTAGGIKPLNLTAYSCSGVVQWSYYWGIARVATEDPLYAPRLKEATFSPRLDGDIDDAELLTITPANLAETNKLAWKYVIKNGAVWEVSNNRDVNDFVNSRKSR